MKALSNGDFPSNFLFRYDVSNNKSMKELNHNTLKNALGQLPQHEPPVQVWDSVVERLQVQTAVEELPEYHPPDFVWDNIEMDLAQAKQVDILQQTIQELPAYEPPALVWESIENELPPTAKIVKMRWLRYAVAAAMVGILFVAGLFLQHQNNETVTVAFTEEVRNVEDLTPDWYEDEDAFATILAFCKTQTFTCEEPLFIDLKSELEELNDARKALETVMGDYGQDANLMKQLARVEHQRSDVLKKMVQLI